MTKPFPLSRAVATATVAVGACALAFACPAAAYKPTNKAGSENTPLNLSSSGGATHTSSSGGASIVRTIVGLAIVIAVIWGLAWILKQVKKGKDPNVSSDGLASVAALTLGSGRSVHLVRAGSDYVLLGSTEHGVAPIHRYSEEQAREVGLLVGEPEAGEHRSLLGAAGQLLAGAGRASARETPPWLPDQAQHSPVVGRRPDPMRMGEASNVIDRLRALTVRR